MNYISLYWGKGSSSLGLSSRLCLDLDGLIKIIWKNGFLFLRKRRLRSHIKGLGSDWRKLLIWLRSLPGHWTRVCNKERIGSALRDLAWSCFHQHPCLKSGRFSSQSDYLLLKLGKWHTLLFLTTPLANLLCRRLGLNQPRKTYLRLQTNLPFGLVFIRSSVLPLERNWKRRELELYQRV